MMTQYILSWSRSLRKVVFITLIVIIFFIEIRVEELLAFIPSFGVQVVTKEFGVIVSGTGNRL